MTSYTPGNGERLQWTKVSSISKTRVNFFVYGQKVSFINALTLVFWIGNKLEGTFEDTVWYGGKRRTASMLLRKSWITIERDLLIWDCLEDEALYFRIFFLLSYPLIVIWLAFWAVVLHILLYRHSVLLWRTISCTVCLTISLRYAFYRWSISFRLNTSYSVI
jgi:hypothetical protein